MYCPPATRSPGLELGAWEGSGNIDYDSEQSIIARRFKADEITVLAETAGFTVTCCVVETVAQMHMDALYIECIK